MQKAEYAKLRAGFRRQRMGFIHVELEAGLTFAEVAKTERKTGNQERADRNVVLAGRACDEARRRLDESEREDAPEAYDLAAEKLSRLRAMLRSLSAGGGG
jgi:hypothetical protein